MGKKLIDPHVILTDLGALMSALPTTLIITLIATIVGLLLGLLLAVIKRNQVPVVHQVTAVIVSFVRGTPLIVQLYLSFYGIPILLQYLNGWYGTHFNVNAINPLWFVLIAFGLHEAAYDSEFIRAALNAVDTGEIEAASSLGMTRWQTYRRIIIPEAFVVALPTLGNAFIGLMKNTSLAFVVSVVDMTAKGQIVAGSNYRYFEVYIALAIIYWALTIITERLLAIIERAITQYQRSERLTPVPTLHRWRTFSRGIEHD
ncbi:MAG: amino acid ABC transporter permease [Lactobacillus sp.]|jgi:polar amino acid transport system permease protein|nr:amino acid ABC transporter permease [Lactobacillus sp.]MCI2032352.1 amino acid ABC transporter permease [Lactobacillus sp.]